MAYPVFIFDWDGTLVDSESHIVNSLRYASSELKLPILSHDQYKNIIGLGMREALHELYPDLSEQDVECMRKKYAEYFFTVEMGEKQLFKGVEETLELLKARGARLAVATGKSRNGLDKALASTGLGHFFDIERCADETRSKPHPLMLEEIAGFYRRPNTDFVMVGDTEYDMAMAAKAGMAAIGVSYGVHESARLNKHGPSHIIDCFTELSSINRD